MTRRPIPHRNGWGTLTALLLLSLTTAATAVTLSTLTADGRRTRAAVAEAQLRQLLLAGGADLSARAAVWPADAPALSWSIAPPLPGYTIEVRVAPDGPAATATVTAHGDGRRLTERVRLTRSPDGHWRTISAELGA